jgi:L-arabinonolactonase
MSLTTSPRNSSTPATAAPARSIRQVQCLRWDGATARWWWADSAAGTLRAWSYDSQLSMHCALPDEAGAFAQCSSGRLLLCQPKRLCLAATPSATQGRAQRAWRLRPLVAVDPAEPRTSIHDGRTDRRGFFVFGTMNEGEDQRPIGSFYQYSLQYGLRRLALPAVSIANSICFSLDGKTMYFTDTPTRRILQCDYDAESAQAANIRLFAAVEDAGAFPDGSIVDRNGCLWNAQWGAGRVVQYSSDGRMLRSLRLAVKNPTCLAFGGVQLERLTVTTSRLEMNNEELRQMPHAGSLFSFDMPAGAGMADTLFDDMTHQQP